MRESQTFSIGKSFRNKKISILSIHLIICTAEKCWVGTCCTKHNHLQSCTCLRGTCHLGPFIYRSIWPDRGHSIVHFIVKGLRFFAVVVKVIFQDLNN